MLSRYVSVTMKLFIAQLIYTFLLSLTFTEVVIAFPPQAITTERKVSDNGSSVISDTVVCTVDLDVSVPAYRPLLVDVNNTWVLPTLVGTSRQFQFSANEEVQVTCPGSGNYLLQTTTSSATGQCLDGTFTFKGDTTGNYGYDDMGCVQKVQETLRESTSCGASDVGTLVNIGWSIDATFVNQFQVCHDTVNSITLYTTNPLYGSAIEAKDKDDSRPSFKRDKYFGSIPVEDAYTQKRELETLTVLLGPTQANIYFNTSKEWYFARGHLSPDADFVFTAHQDATYYYINAAPQWQAFNNGNWKWLEYGTRDQAIARQRTLTIYTGTFGVLTLADSNNNQVPIYLYFDANNVGYLPVPKYFWKVVHDSATNEAVAFVGINNPHITALMSDDVLCTDVCSQITWATWAINNFARGYMYCCTVDELRASVPSVPDLGPVNLMV